VKPALGLLWLKTAFVFLLRLLRLFAAIPFVSSFESFEPSWFSSS
jgi:hypothetical protein